MKKITTITPETLAEFKKRMEKHAIQPFEICGKKYYGTIGEGFCGKEIETQVYKDILSGDIKIVSKGRSRKSKMTAQLIDELMKVYAKGKLDEKKIVNQIKDNALNRKDKKTERRNERKCAAKKNNE